MADTDRAQTHDLIAEFLRDRDLRRAGLFPIVRQLEARAPGKPRIGRAKRPEQSVVDLAQEANLAFPDRTLAGVQPMPGRPQLRGYWLGLTGPMGPLPTHLSEYVFYERRYAKKRPFGDWLDLISARMLQMFYRAWAESQPVAHADRPGDDRFADWLSALSGCAEGVRPDAAFFPRARVHYAAVFAGLRSAAAIQDALTHLLGQPVRVVEYMPKWREFEYEDLSRLGDRFSTLGSDVALGRRVFSASDAFRVIVRADSFRDYRTLLPGGERFKVAAEAIDAFKPGHLEWDLTVEIDDADAPAARLDGRIQLGWTSWLKRPSAPRKMTRRGPGPGSGMIRADAHLRKSSMKPRKAKP
jgi:type VI secretion system ImpH/TssG family protein